MVDAGGLIDLEGKGQPDLWLISSIALLIILIADLGFTGFRSGNLGLIVTSFLFIITLVSYIALSETVILSDGHILDGALGFTLGVFALNIGNILAGFNLSLLSTASESYLAGVLGQGSSTVIPIVNVVFAPIGETFLIFGLTAALWQLGKRVGIQKYPVPVIVLAVGLIPSIIFGALHGRGGQFLLFSGLINLGWTALLVYGELGKITTKYVPVGLGLVAGLHMGFNSSNFGGIFSFIATMFDALGTQFGRSATVILVYLFLMFGLGFIRLFMILDEEVF